MNGYEYEPIHERYEFGNYVVIVHHLPLWLQFEARLYITTQTGSIELGKFIGNSILQAKTRAINSIGGYSGIIPKDETKIS